MVGEAGWLFGLKGVVLAVVAMGVVFAVVAMGIVFAVVVVGGWGG